MRESLMSNVLIARKHKLNDIANLIIIKLTAIAQINRKILPYRATYCILL